MARANFVFIKLFPGPILRLSLVFAMFLLSRALEASFMFAKLFHKQTLRASFIFTHIIVSQPFGMIGAVRCTWKAVQDGGFGPSGCNFPRADRLTLQIAPKNAAVPVRGLDAAF
jgi:hypothetical protein